MKTTVTQEPLLSFEFASETGEIKPYTFRNPIKVITTDTIEDILLCFQHIQEAIDAGYYAAGYLSYECAPAFDPAFKVKKGHSFPLLWFGIFSKPELQSVSSSGHFNVTEWKPSIKKDEYHSSILAIKQLIESGDTYQTNYTISLNSQFEGDDLAFFEKLKRAQTSSYCAYLNTGVHSILSASPELFFHLENHTITTRPMKGTTKRGNSFSKDQANSSWLFHSEKNRAENIMIVDLLRNDLNMIAKPGTVQVPKLFEIEQYPTVHQMTSTITAKVSENILLVDIFKALFPCGSITGAPKVSTMKIIADLETTSRDVYCGAIGFITPNKKAIFNVPIRTVVIDQQTGKATYGVGGGITWDSTTEDEYDEIITKASLLEEDRPEFQLLESILLDNGHYFLLEEHLNRLKNSALYFGFSFQLANVVNTLNYFASQNNKGLLKVRFLLSKNGEITTETQLITQPTGVPIKVMVAEEPVKKNNPFLYHKTTNRKIYSGFQMKKPADVFDVLLWNEDEELTEFTNGNIVLEIDGIHWTPPVNSGLLAGTFRELLIKNGEILEKTLTVNDLKNCNKVWFINSVRKWLEVDLISLFRKA
ncbi:aminodeoxychorismate synthase component I [Bacillus sp. 1NLA3E]|uniref:aminodeoxychorismate synthase component I n=1 Tax=Bacillus sp. 1NLA3E TaxID=666686 RepID=UPI000247F004|nr:aminodeoxychorismate synthase component I [Bacillus sp. 1NLA3E]AGK53972.1 para-aminobenzoate synthase component II [Bacillus sp. 1NLA3E]